MLTSNELEALTYYTGQGNRDLNKALRSGYLQAFLQEKRTLINSALAKLPGYIGTVYRGEAVTQENVLIQAQYYRELKDLSSLLVFPAFTSATKELRIARRFSDQVLFVIDSVKGKDISGFSLMPEEEEVLFPPATAFEIVEIRVEKWGKIPVRLVVFLKDSS